MAITGSGYDEQLHGLWGPLLFVYILAFFTIEMFNEVFGMAIWTILQCYIADEEMFGDGKGAMYVPGNLKNTISKTNKDAIKIHQEYESNKNKIAPGPDDGAAAPAAGGKDAEELP